MTQSFEDILSTPTDEIEKPQPLPQGNYIMRFTDVKMDKTTPKPDSGKEPSPFAEFTVSVISPYSDVDEDDLEAAGGCDGKTNRMTFYLTPNAQYRLKEFAQDVLAMNTEGLSLGELIQQSLRIDFIGSIVHNPSQRDSSVIYANIGKTAKLLEE